MHQDSSICQEVALKQPFQSPLDSFVSRTLALSGGICKIPSVRQEADLKRIQGRCIPVASSEFFGVKA